MFQRYDHGRLLISLRHDTGKITALRLEVPDYEMDWQAERQPDGRWTLTAHLDTSLSQENLPDWPAVYDSIPEAVADSTGHNAPQPLLRPVQRYVDQAGRVTAPGEVERVETDIIDLVAFLENTWGVERAVHLLRVGLMAHGYRVMPDPEFIAKAGVDCQAYIEIKSKMVRAIEASGHDEEVTRRALRQLKAMETVIASFQVSRGSGASAADPTAGSFGTCDRAPPPQSRH